MSKIAQLLAQKRAAQIAGEACPDVDKEISRAQSRASRDAEKAGQRRKQREASRGLYFSKHAQKRMAQRGFTPRDIYFIWQRGTAHKSGGDTVYHMDQLAMEEAPRAFAHLTGSAIIVEPAPEPALRPVLITVLADGEDTRFRVNRYD